MPNRMISLERNTNETQIDLTLDLDGTGRYEWVFDHSIISQSSFQ